MQHRRILIIDDSSMTRARMKALLESLPVKIDEAANGAEALAAVSNRSYALIITDVAMPVMNGIELCQRLKNNPDTKGIPIIIVSAFDTDADIERGFQAGVAEYIPKSEVLTRLPEAAQGILTDYSFRRQREILVVDDSATIRKAVEDCLHKAGFQVVTAENGKVALRLLEQHQPDLILSDLNMPELGGAELCAQLRSHPDYGAIPFVAMSSISDRSKMIGILNRGASAYLIKPFNLDQLVSVLDKLLSDQFLLLHKEKERLDTEKKMLLVSITSLVAALEARDPYTRGHSESVAEILTRIASFTNTAPEEIANIAIGGKLHDLGKIGVRDSVLLKNGKLTDEEYAHIKTHPDTGTRILQVIPSFTVIMPIIRHHHERWDGRGYPDGLVGDAIPRWARLAAVADTYHALVSDRPYRQGMSHQRALEIITDACGSQLCPESVDLFLTWIATLDDRELFAISGKNPPPACAPQSGENK